MQRLQSSFVRSSRLPLAACSFGNDNDRLSGLKTSAEYARDVTIEDNQIIESGQPPAKHSSASRVSEEAVQ